MRGGEAAPGVARDAVFPPFFQYDAPSDWRAIDFISDLHLSESMPRTFAAWARHLRTTSADAVVMLGDLFEVWVGDDARQRPFERQCVEVIADAATRRVVAFMAGNRDFLLGHAMTLDCGMISLPDPTRLVAWGQSVVLSHGDALCLDDAPYQAFRAEVRSPEWQSRFLARPLPERLMLAAEMRRQSMGRRRFDGDADADINAAQAVMWLHALGSAELVHGHTHRPGSSSLAPGFKRHVLSDWDLDQGQRAEVLRLTRQGFERLAPAGL
ncbi:MAG: UDP-2,3-diacylglucosamine diphosphatase [Rubrivivax sp.]|nr:UDP-2,3-diacylglucosamine diphosphatase [Rubrivivax sp.]